MKIEFRRVLTISAAIAMSMMLTGCTSDSQSGDQSTAQPVVQATAAVVVESNKVSSENYQPSAYDYVMSYTGNTRGVVFVAGDKVEQKFTAQDDYLDNVYFLTFPEEGTQGTPTVKLLDSNGNQIAATDLVHGAEDGTRVIFDIPVNKGEEYTLLINFDGITGGGFVGYFNAVTDTDGTCGSATVNGEAQTDVLFTQYVYLTKAQ